MAIALASPGGCPGASQGIITGIVLNESPLPANAVFDAYVEIKSLNKQTRTGRDGQYNLSIGDAQGLLQLDYIHPSYAGNVSQGYSQIVVTAPCSTHNAPLVIMKLCGNGRLDVNAPSPEDCFSCQEDVPCGLGMTCAIGAYSRCVDYCPPGRTCVPACPAGLQSNDSGCFCNVKSDGFCGCNGYCNDPASHLACNTCLSVCANPRSIENDPDCIQRGLVLTHKKVSLIAPGKNVLSSEKLVIYKGNAVKIKIVTWGKAG